MNQQILREQIDLAAITTQQFQIVINVIDGSHSHPTMDATQKRSSFVERKSAACFSAKEVDDLAQRFFTLLAVGMALLPGPDIIMSTILDNSVRNLCQLENEIHHACHNRAAGHPVESCILRILCDDETAALPDSLQPDAAIRARPCEDYRNCALAILRRQGMEEEVQR